MLVAAGNKNMIIMVILAVVVVDIVAVFCGGSDLGQVQ